MGPVGYSGVLQEGKMAMASYAHFSILRHIGPRAKERGWEKDVLGNSLPEAKSVTLTQSQKDR